MTKDLIEEIRKKIEKEGLEIADELFDVEKVTDENRKEFNNIWKKVWQEEKYYEEGETIKERENYYNQYKENSEDIILSVKDKSGRKIPIGTMRLVRNEEKGLPAFTDPTFKDKIDKKFKERKSIEFTLLAVLPEWRGLKHFTSFMLWREGYKYVKENKAEQIILITDEKLINIFKKIGFPVEEIVEPTEYEGGKCGVYAIPIEKVEKKIRVINPEIFKWFTKGIDPSLLAK